MKSKRLYLDAAVLVRGFVS